MDCIFRLELANQVVLPEVINAVRSTTGVIKIANGAEFAEILSYPFAPSLGTWFGLSLDPLTEEGITIAVRQYVSGLYYQFTVDGWIASSSPVFQSLNVIRSGLSSWNGPLQLRLRLQRDADGRSPQVAAVKLGYSVVLEPSSYLLEYALPEYFKRPVQISRRVRVAAGSSVLTVDGLRLDRVSQASLLCVPSQIKLPVSYRATPKPALVIESPTPTALFGYLICDYPLRVDWVKYDQSYQIETVPAVVLRQISESSPLRLYAEDWVQESDDHGRSILTWDCFNLVFEAVVVSDSDAEAKAIGKQLLLRLRQSPKIGLPPFGVEVFAGVTRRLSPGPGQVGAGEVGVASLESFGFQFQILYFTDSTTANTQDLVRQEGGVVVRPNLPDQGSLSES